MFYYFYIFLISGILLYIAEKLLQRNIKILFYVFSFAAIYCCAYFAGVRDLTVGYDVTHYETSIFQDACTTKSFIKLIKWNSTIEPFFLFLNYVSCLISDDIHVCLGIISFITFGFAYLACLRLSRRSRIPLWVLYIIFMLYYYANSMNLLRQSVCVSICFYLYAYLKDNGWNKYSYAIAILAVFSHITAVFPIAAYICIRFTSQLSYKKFLRFYLFLIVSLVTVLYLYSAILTKLTVLTGKNYDSYANLQAAGGAGWAELHIPFSTIMFVSFFSYLICKLRNNIQIQRNRNEYICTITFISITIILGGFFMGNFSRLNLYFVDLIAYYLCFVLYDAKKYSRPLVTLFMIALFVFLYIRTFYDGLEYTSLILGIK